MQKPTHVPTLTRLRRAVSIAALAIAASSVVACAGARPVVHADWERSVDLDSFHAFSVLPSPRLPELDERQKSLARVVEASTFSTLSRRGYRAVDASEAELHVVHSAARRVRTHVTVASLECSASAVEIAAGLPYTGSGLGWEESFLQPRQESTLILDAYDAAEGRLIWHGWANVTTPAPDDPHTSELVVEAVAEILSQYPERS